ncbi:VOC family protein [uncultured Oscillibacter sp.]|uniref:VOC family protein n=1 Tax=uncultured Oscillibacter sp. TaxID=876091 RepID=UPI002631C245|nr:VOC family protein [uncultured Oscillibacter sp.]
MAQRKEWMKQIFQIVMVVENLDKTLENWKRLVEFDTASIRTGETPRDAECIYCGKPVQCPARYAVFDLGGVEMKLVEPLNQEGPYADSLKKGGPGIHHLGFYTEDMDALTERFQERGEVPVYEETCCGGHYALYDFTAGTGMTVAPWDHMEGPCAR